MSAAATLAQTVDSSDSTSSDRIEPQFRIELVRHIGLVLTSYTERYSFTGSYRECQDEIDFVQRQNRRTGWWSPRSAYRDNPAALAANNAARTALAREAAWAFGHPSAWRPQNDELVAA